MYTATPSPIPATTPATAATVSANPGAVAGSSRERMNRRSLFHRISWSSTATVAVRAGSACGHARTAIPATTPTAALTIRSSRMTSTTSGSTVRGGGADLRDRRSDVRLDGQIAERHDPDRTVGLDDGEASHLQVLHQIDDASDGVGGAGGDEVPTEDLLDGRGIRVPTLGNGADRDIPVRDDARHAFGAGLDHDHVADVVLRHQTRGRGQRRVEGDRLRGSGHHVADLNVAREGPGGHRPAAPSRRSASDPPDRRRARLRRERVPGAETHDRAQQTHGRPSFAPMMSPPT